jgi:hypothetical protein
VYGPPVVRTHSRSQTSRRALAALGVMAGLVALAGNPQPTQPADAAVGDGSSLADIRRIDFAAFAQPGSTCSQALPEAPPRLIDIEGGASGVLDEPSVARVEIGGDVLYADLDGDGDDEAVVHAMCAYGANGVQDTVQVWSLIGPLPVLVDTVTGPPADVAAASDLPPAVHDVAVDDGELIVTFTHYAEGDPNCCPTGQTAVSYELNGELEAAGAAATGPIES